MTAIANLPRNVAAALVYREERRTGSRMLAYEVVAQMVGTSATWLRSYLSTNGAKEPGFMVGINLIQVYRQVCERVEQAGDRELQLRNEIDAALEGARLLVATAKETDRSST